MLQKTGQQRQLLRVCIQLIMQHAAGAEQAMQGEKTTCVVTRHHLFGVQSYAFETAWRAAHTLKLAITLAALLLLLSTDGVHRSTEQLD
jgi:hypothetical protein